MAIARLGFEKSNFDSKERKTISTASTNTYLGHQTDFFPCIPTGPKVKQQAT
jgi:hypothetical protein